MIKKMIIFFIVSFLFIWGCEELQRRKIGGLAGTYPFVESWQINYSESEVLEAIKELKKQNPIIQPPNYSKLIGKRDTSYKWKSYDSMFYYMNKLKTDSIYPIPANLSEISSVEYWLFVNFYYSDTKEIVFTWTRPDVMDSTITTLALVGFSKLNDSTDYRLINRDFWYVANKIQINKFKKTIFQPIIDKLEERNKRNKK